jgi:hypothetical protein
VPKTSAPVTKSFFAVIDVTPSFQVTSPTLDEALSFAHKYLCSLTGISRGCVAADNSAELVQLMLQSAAASVVRWVNHRLMVVVFVPLDGHAMVSGGIIFRGWIRLLRRRGGAHALSQRTGRAGEEDNRSYNEFFRGHVAAS